MYNHQWLFPEKPFLAVTSDQLADSSLAQFPTAEQLAEQVVQELAKAAPDSTIALADNHGAEFNNNLVLEVRNGQTKHAVHIDPVRHSSQISELPANQQPESLLNDVHTLQLSPDPYDFAKQAVPHILTESGVPSDGSIHPLGWCKLNFLANVDGEPARVTYVLRDSHVDVSKFVGDDGMTPRQFFMRLHTSHGQPPHWNARMIWSVFLDTMAIAMVTWGATGLVMWWQIKRTRLIGMVVIAASMATALWLYFAMSFFYASTQL